MSYYIWRTNFGGASRVRRGTGEGRTAGRLARPVQDLLQVVTGLPWTASRICAASALPPPEVTPVEVWPAARSATLVVASTSKFRGEKAPAPELDLVRRNLEQEKNPQWNFSSPRFFFVSLSTRVRFG